MGSRFDADLLPGVAAAGGVAGAFALAGTLNAPGTLVLALVAFAALMAARLPVAGVGAVLLALPYFYHPLQLGARQFAASELLLAAALAGAAGRLMVAAVRDARPAPCVAASYVLRLVASPLFVAAVVLTGVGLLLALQPFSASHRADAVREWRWTLLEPTTLLALLLLVAHGAERSARRTLAWCFLLGAAVASVHGLSNIAFGGGVDVEGVRRIAGPYPHPNALALYVVRGAVFGLAWSVFDRRARWSVGAVSAICLSAVAATFSRGAWAAVALVVVVLVWRAAPRLRWPAVGAGSLAFVGALLLAGDRMRNLFGGGSGSLRVDIWRATLPMIRDRPVLGYGPDQFLYVYSPRYVAPTAWTERFTAHPHNLLLDFWVRLGIIGAALAIAGVLWCVARLVRAYWRVETDDALRVAALTALFAAITHGLVDNAYFLHDLAMSAWLLFWLTGTPPFREHALEKGKRSVEGPVGWRSRLHRLPSLRQFAG